MKVKKIYFLQENIFQIQFYKKIKFLFDNYYHIKYMRIKQYNNLIIQIDNL